MRELDGEEGVAADAARATVQASSEPPAARDTSEDQAVESPESDGSGFALTPTSIALGVAAVVVGLLAGLVMSWVGIR